MAVAAGKAPKIPRGILLSVQKNCGLKSVYGGRECGADEATSIAFSLFILSTWLHSRPNHRKCVQSRETKGLDFQLEDLGMGGLKT